jgi:RNA polymerase-binding transcription factor DksA
MDAKSAPPGEARILALVGLPRVSTDAAALRWRFRLESMWERKVDEVLALAAASQGDSVAGDKSTVADLRSRRLHRRTARAYEDLAGIVDAILRIDAGTYGLCASCHQRMPDEWLADEPQILHCSKCHVRTRPATT